MKLWRKFTVLLLAAVLLVAAPAAYGRQSDSPDVERLQQLLEMADGMEQFEYTAESWEVLRRAVAVAKAAMGSGIQARIDSAVPPLAAALSDMEKMDYSEMEAILAEAEQLLAADAACWQQLHTALEAAQAACRTGDQALVDSTAIALAQCLQACREYAGQDDGSKNPVVWIVLLGVSLLGNAALVTQLLWKKKENRHKQIDDVPLVDYDIDDDVI